MKKILKTLLIVSLLVFVVGCGEKKAEGNNTNTNEHENEKAEVKLQAYQCNITSNDVVNGYKLDAVYNIYAEGDIVKNVSTEEKVTSEDSDILDYFETTLKTAYEAADSSYGGYVYDITRSGNEIVSKTTIDYSIMDLDQYVADNSVLKSYVNDKNELTVDGVKNLYISMGATCE